MAKLNKLIFNMTLMLIMIFTFCACNSAKQAKELKLSSSDQQAFLNKNKQLITENENRINPRLYRENNNTDDQTSNDNTSIKTIEILKKKGTKHYFKYYSPTSEKKKYVQIVWSWMLKDLNIDPKLGIKEIKEKWWLSNEMMFMIFTDFNSDKKEDFIVMPRSLAYCAVGGTKGCNAFIFLGPEYSTVIYASDIYQNFPEANSLYILKTSTNGLKDFIKNNKFLCKFNGKYNSKDKNINDTFYSCE